MVDVDGPTLMKSPPKNGGWETILSWEKGLRSMSKLAISFGEGNSSPHICKVGPYDRYNPYKWPYQWVTGVKTLLIGVPCQSIYNDRRGPPCLVNCHLLDHPGI